jgi:hypothetical protein
VAAVFTCTHCDAVPEQVVEGKGAIAIVRHKLGCPNLADACGTVEHRRAAEKMGDRSMEVFRYVDKSDDAVTATDVATAPDGVNEHFEITGRPTGTYFLKVEIQGRKPWYFSNQVSDTAAQPIAIRSGLTRKMVLRIP